MRDRSDLYTPPRNWPDRAEDWYEQVNRISDCIREQIAQEIENKINGVFWEQGGGETEYIPKWLAAAIARGKK